MAEKVLVNLIRCWDGPRHQQLDDIWTATAELYQRRCQLKIHNNPDGRVRHDQMLNHIWKETTKEPHRFVLITEFDFLPSKNWLPTSRLTPGHPVMAAEYVTRQPGTRKLSTHAIPGAWYILVDREYAPDLDFTAGGKFNDPANRLAADLVKRYLGRSVNYLIPTDLYPSCYGVHYWTGIHLFWSRHYNDNPGKEVAGFPLSDILFRHDQYVRRWVLAQPTEFQRLLPTRSPPVVEAARGVVNSDRPAGEGDS